MENKILVTILIAIGSLLGFTLSEVVDEKFTFPILEKPDLEKPVTTKECPSTKIIAYTDNDKYYCECIGPECPCTRTDEILSSLG